MSAIEIPTAPRRPGDGVRLFAFTVGHVHMPVSYFIDGEEGEIRAPVTAFLIDHPKGAVLFDTGLGQRFVRPRGTARESFIDLEAGETIDEKLRAIGVEPAEIRWIIVSHFHTDHAGGNAYFPNATIVTQEAEYDYAFNNAGEDPIYEIAEYDLGQPFLKVRGEHDLFGDGTIIIFPTLGHTPGHQSAKIRTDGGDVVLTGDCCSLQRSLDEFKLPASCHDADQFLASLKHLASLRDRGAKVLPSHDPVFWADMPLSVPLS
ncbi:N-acyl homoserine lactonase family protein [Novosphingobium rosa]|uniref:N-acyl homoserine lactonase family protein n=1 Tax=Novosphingobium rosa TaxID=76978 RepID=UPI00082CE882|nr:N-acyl homoserine lactonase family protein [Novosphingobium rosa]